MLGNAYYHIMGRSPNYGRNSNILIPDPYHPRETKIGKGGGSEKKISKRRKNGAFCCILDIKSV